MLYLSQDMPMSAVFFVHTNSGGALSGILYFELPLSHKQLLWLCTKLEVVWPSKALDQVMDLSNDVLHKQEN